MMLTVRSTIRLAFSRLVSVSVCLCALTFLPGSQLVGMAMTESSEVEFPIEEEDGEFAEEELVVGSSARRRLSRHRHSDAGRPYKTGTPLAQTIPSGSRLSAKVGHELANGLCAPRLV
ncbi:MAG: hypothetical protein HOL01_03415 [Planctomycetaceae bacterium]|nr:hypothetical protein [Planctomycetaceae bacterium]